jgi:S1-C subfamily serine protease
MIVSTAAAVCVLASAVAATDDVARSSAARFREVAPALVQVHVLARNESPNGGTADWELDLVGVLVAADGLVLVPGSIKPDRHVRTTLLSISVTPTDGATVDATFVTKDADLGLAFLRVREPRPEGYPFVRFDADAPDLEIGDEALTFGILPESLEHGRRCELLRVCAVLSRPRRLVLVNENLGDNLGSPVVRLDGSVAGIVATPRLIRSASSAPLGEDGALQNVTPPCILPASVVAKRIADLPHDGATDARPWIGIRTQPIAAPMARSLGAPDGDGFFLVSRVFPDSPAERAGLREEDEILACGGDRLRPEGDADADLLAEALGRHRAGETVELVVRRGGVEAKLQVSLEAAPVLQDSARVVRNEAFGVTARESTYFDVVDVPAGVDRKEAAAGIVATSVDRAGFAGLAGLSAGDLVLRIDGRPVGGVDAFRETLDAAARDHAREVVFFFLRGSSTQFVTVRADWKNGG